MTRERAAELLSEVMVLDDPEMAEAHRVAISALRQQEHFRDLTKMLLLTEGGDCHSVGFRHFRVVQYHNFA